MQEYASFRPHPLRPPSRRRRWRLWSARRPLPLPTATPAFTQCTKCVACKHLALGCPSGTRAPMQMLLCMRIATMVGSAAQIVQHSTRTSPAGLLRPPPAGWAGWPQGHAPGACLGPLGCHRAGPGRLPRRLGEWQGARMGREAGLAARCGSSCSVSLGLGTICTDHLVLQGGECSVTAGPGERPPASSCGYRQTPSTLLLATFPPGGGARRVVAGRGAQPAGGRRGLPTGVDGRRGPAVQGEKRGLSPTQCVGEGSEKEMGEGRGAASGAWLRSRDGQAALTCLHMPPRCPAHSLPALSLPTPRPCSCTPLDPPASPRVCCTPPRATW